MEFVKRSAFGWPPTRATRANPRRGLVIHYDGANQGLAGKPHSACVAYWKRTRRFHMRSRGWVDIGYCVDEATEILTDTGWRTFREIASGDLVLTLNHETGLSEWQPVQDVLIFPEAPREMIRMRGRSHSSLSTPNHRWPVERFFRRAGTRRKKNADGTWRATGRSPRVQQGYERVWATTETLTYWDRIPLSAPSADTPSEPKWSDALVELVAWFWTEGFIKPQSRSRLPSTGVAIYQKEGENADRIRAALTDLFGPPADAFPRSGKQTDGRPRWRESVTSRRLVEFHLSTDAGRVLLEQAPSRVPRFEFLRSLTKAQLDLYLEASLLADGNNGRTVTWQNLAQKSRARAEAFQFAAILAGRSTSIRQAKSGVWIVHLRSRVAFSPRAAAVTNSDFIGRVVYKGHVWCVRTPNGTWLAKREGSVYFTGNSFAACPHGYVFEGRGLNRTQAAQPGGNTTWYSCTLMSGPSERPNSAQINAVRELRQWLMGKGVAGAVRGHRDFVSTSCPGNIAYRMVKDGTFRKSPEEDDDVPTYVSVDKTRDSRTETVTAGEWQQIYFNQNNSEGAKRHHADGDWPSLVKGPADYTGTIKLRLTELPKGVEGQARVIEVTRRGDDWRVVERDWPVEFAGTGGDTFVTIPAAGFVSDDRRLRVEVTHFGEDGVRPKVVGGQVRLQVWER